EMVILTFSVGLTVRARKEPSDYSGLTGVASDLYSVNLRKKLSGFHRGRAASLATMVASAAMNRLYAAAAARSTGWLRSSDGAWYRFVSHAFSRASSGDPFRFPNAIMTAGIP